MRKGYLVLLCSLLVLSVLFSVMSCAQSAPTPTPTPTSTPTPVATPKPTAAAPAPASIKIGCAISVTGRNAAGALEVRQGYKIAVDHLNKAGGIYVKQYDKKIPVELVMLDDESDPLKAVARLETIVAEQKPVVFAGGASSTIHAALVAAAEKNKVPYVGVGFTLYSIHEQGYKYLFSPFNKTPQLIAAVWKLLETIPSANRPTKVAIFTRNNDWGLEQTKIVRDTLPQGYQVVMEKEFGGDTKDFSSLILAAKAAGADALFTNPPPEQGFPLWKQVKELDWMPKFAWVDAAATVDVWTSTLGADGDYVTAESPYHWTYPYPMNKEFVADFQKEYGRIPRPVSGTAYVVFQVLANAIEKAGVLDKDKVRDAIAATDMMTIMGPMKFDGKGVGIFPVGISQWLKGKQEQVWPKEVQTAPFAYPAPSWSARK